MFWIKKKVKDLFIFICYFPDIFLFLSSSVWHVPSFFCLGDLLNFFKAISSVLFQSLHISFTLKVTIYIIPFDGSSTGFSEQTDLWYIFLHIGLDFRVVFSPMTLACGWESRESHQFLSFLDFFLIIRTELVTSKLFTCCK